MGARNGALERRLKSCNVGASISSDVSRWGDLSVAKYWVEEVIGILFWRFEMAGFGVAGVLAGFLGMTIRVAKATLAEKLLLTDALWGMMLLETVLL